jgi:hypothetical protein
VDLARREHQVFMEFVRVVANVEAAKGIAQIAKWKSIWHVPEVGMAATEEAVSDVEIEFDVLG